MLKDNSFSVLFFFLLVHMRQPCLLFSCLWLCLYKKVLNHVRVVRLQLAVSILSYRRRCTYTVYTRIIYIVRIVLSIFSFIIDDGGNGVASLSLSPICYINGYIHRLIHATVGTVLLLYLLYTTIYSFLSCSILVSEDVVILSSTYVVLCSINSVCGFVDVVAWNTQKTSGFFYIIFFFVPFLLFLFSTFWGGMVVN